MQADAMSSHPYLMRLPPPATRIGGFTSDVFPTANRLPPTPNLCTFAQALGRFAPLH
jgi:hypothetical protein